MFSGIATMSRELVMGTLYHYNFIQIAGGLNHPEKGKMVDMSEAVAKVSGVTDAYLKLYPVDGYGNEDILMAVMNIEKPDAILHFTDPRYWGWLYQIERKIREKTPLTYYSIWDDLPLPMWNRPFYESCDGLFAISKQTHNIHKWVLRPENCRTIDGTFDKEGNEILDDFKLTEIELNTKDIIKSLENHADSLENE